MSDVAAGAGAPPRAFGPRMALIYSVFFAYVGLYLPYYPLWLKESGLDAGQISLILSLPLLLRIFTSGQISAFADRIAERANVLIALFAGAAIFVSLLPFVEGFWPILAVTLALALFNNPIQPVSDSITLSGVRRFGADYGRIRLWGSVVFILTNLAGGLLLAQSGAGAVLGALIAIAWAGLLLSPLTPRLGRPRKPASAGDIANASALRLLTKRRFMLVTLGCWLAQSTHAFLYSFGSIYWADAGYSGNAIGAFWAVGVIAEILLFHFSRRVFGRVSPVTLAAIGAAGAAIRWAAMPLEPGFAGFLLLQTLHGLSFGATHLGLMHFLNEAVPEERMGAAQGVGFVLGAGFMAAGVYASGPLYAWAGIHGYLAMAAMAAGSLALLLAGRSSPPDRFADQPQRAGEGGETRALE